MLARWSTLRPIVGRSVLVFILLSLLSLAMPTAAPTPRNLAPDQGAVDNQDDITLAIGNVAPDDLAVLRWDWTIRDGASTPKLYASVHATGGTGTLIFTGPISNRVESCTMDSRQTTLVRGRPPTEIRDAPEVFLVSESLVARIDFSIDPDAPGGPVIHCSLSPGFASDDPPYHQLYTPQMKIVPQGDVNVDPNNPSVCVGRTVPGKAAESDCVDRNAWPTARIAAAVDELDRPSEQGLRDARLILVGVLAGFAGQAIWELGKQLLDLGRLGLDYLRKRSEGHPANAGSEPAGVNGVTDSSSDTSEPTAETSTPVKAGVDRPSPSSNHDVGSAGGNAENDF